MSQSSQVGPNVTANVAGTRRQINLRDYLNQRVAPFLKKAIHESLESEAEFPLQWLGEQLIQQSILYEGNPDSTNIRERFLYKHDSSVSKPATQLASTDTVSTVGTSPAPTSAVSPMVNEEQTMVNAPITNGWSTDAPAPAHNTSTPGEVRETAGQSTAPDEASHDTEMGGTA